MSELWDLYNEKREKTGETLLRGMPVPPNRYHLVVSVWIVNEQGEYLLSQRHSNKQYPLYWECTGGSVLAGEDSISGAIREVKEELGVSLDTGQGMLIYQTQRERTQDFYDVWMFRADIDISQLILQETEVLGAQWVKPDELLNMYKTGKLHPLIDYLHKILNLPESAS